MIADKGRIYYNRGQRTDMNRYICIDIGGTAIKYGIIREDGKFLYQGKCKTEAYKGGRSILTKVENIVEKLDGPEKIAGICISTAGIVDTETGIITHAASLIPDYAGVNYKRTLKEKFGVPCEVENDVNCAGLAEYISGAAKGSRSSLMLTIGTGIGGSFIRNGEIFHGAGNGACEVGYMYMDKSDFQTLGAASSLTKKVAACKNEPEDRWDGYHIFEAAKAGDSLCVLAIDEMAEVLGKGIANICYVLAPEVVVLGGGIMAQKEYLGRKIENAVHRYLIPHLAGNIRIVFAEHENNAGMLGAFYHFHQKH